MRPAAFQTPAWSPDGSRLLVAAQSGDQAELVMTNRDASLYRVLHRARTAPAFAWSPDGKQVAYITRTVDEEGVRANLHVIGVEGDGTEPTALTADSLVIGFFWSPDSSKIAYFVPGTYVNPEDEQQQTLFLTMHVHNLRRDTSPRNPEFRAHLAVHVGSTAVRSVLPRRPGVVAGQPQHPVCRIHAAGSRHHGGEGGQQPRAAPGGRRSDRFLVVALAPRRG